MIHHLPDLRGLLRTLPEIRSDPVPQYNRFPDIYDHVILIMHKIHAGLLRKLIQFLPDVKIHHMHILPYYFLQQGTGYSHSLTNTLPLMFPT